MSPTLIVYLALLAPVGIGVAVYQEAERRESDDPRDEEAILAPALDGLAAAICWPVLAVLAAFVGFLAAVAWVARQVADRVLKPDA